MQNEIDRISLSIKYFDPQEMSSGRKDTYELWPSGKTVFRTYTSDSRKCLGTNETNHATPDDFSLLIKKLNDCIASADRNVVSYDSRLYSIKIYYRFGRVEFLPGGYGNEDRTVSEIVREYIFHAAGMDF